MLVYQSDCCRLQSVQHFCLRFHPNAACQLRAVKQNFSLAFWTERPPSAICLQSVHCPYLFLPPILLLITLPLSLSTVYCLKCLSPLSPILHLTLCICSQMSLLAAVVGTAGLGMLLQLPHSQLQGIGT